MRCVRHTSAPSVPRRAACARALSLTWRRAEQAGRLPLHYAAANQASEAVVKALLEAHHGAAKEKTNVRPP